MISNIYNNPEKDIYRKVRKINKNVESFGRFASGKKLMVELGWKEDNEHWVNDVDVKYLKIWRSDLDLAFSRYRDKDKKGT